MTTQHDTIFERAIAWHLASERDDMDWDGFTAWLEADPRHAAAYDEIALSDAALADHADVLDEAFADADRVPAAANDDAPLPSKAGLRRWVPWAGGALAASLVALAVTPQLGGPEAQTYTTTGGSQLVALEDGSQIELAPHSKLTVDGPQQEKLALEGGAWFDIRHDPSRPMTITAGSIAISDIGTSFDIQASGDQVRVEVADGEVSVSGQALAQPVRLVAGRGFHYDGKAGTAQTRSVGQGDFGEWREGRLSYDNAPLALVAADLARYAGVEIKLAQGLDARRFSGTLALGDGKAAVQDLAQLMGLALVADGVGYRLEPTAR